MRNIKYSIVVCLHNSCEFLDEQLSRISVQDLNLLNCTEMLVIDNASNKRISREIKKIADKHSAVTVRYLYEPLVGAQHARNRGVEESLGLYLLYLDDDALPCAGWLAAIAKSFEEDSNQLIQGRISLLYKREKPVWITPYLEMLLSKVDLGEDGALYSPTFVLANMAIPKQAFKEVGGWDATIGRKGSILLSGEDAEFAMRVAQLNTFHFTYCNEACVEHVVRDNRYKKNYHEDRSYWQGVTTGYLIRTRPYVRKFMCGLSDQIKIGLGSLALWIVFTVTKDKRAFTYKCRFLSLVGFLYGLLFFKGLSNH